MKRYIITILLVFVWAQIGLTQMISHQVSLSDTTISFGLVETGVIHIQSIYVVNDSPQAQTILNAEFEENNFYANVLSWEIPAHGSAQVNIEFETDQNMDYVDFLRIHIEGLSYPLIARVEAQGNFTDSYYNLTQNKSGEELKSTLQTIIDEHSSLGYTIARDHMYGSIDNKSGYVECVYTGRTAEFDTRAGATANNFNCEHTWPQSFFDSNEPMRSDLFHLYPTDITANSQRGSYDFGDVVSASWSQGGSSAGTDATGHFVFEPRDAHKGNVARSHFYFTVRYGGLYDSYTDSEKMESLFRQWNLSDPVDATEQQRNEAIYSLQGNRNPFIDHPEFTDRINNFFGVCTTNTQSEIVVTPESFYITQVATNEEIGIIIALVNTGNAILYVSAINSSDSKFTLSETSANINVEDYKYINIHYTAPASETVDSTRITINSNDADESEITIPIKVQVVEPSALTAEDMLPNSTELYQNFPNPFNPTTTISYSVGAKGRSPLQHIILSIYNILGQKITTLVSENQQPGRYEIKWNAATMPAGIYYYRIQSENFSATRRMILIK